jgi:hypothetical protein
MCGIVVCQKVKKRLETAEFFFHNFFWTANSLIFLKNLPAILKKIGQDFIHRHPLAHNDRAKELLGTFFGLPSIRK